MESASLFCIKNPRIIIRAESGQETVYDRKHFLTREDVRRQAEASITKAELKVGTDARLEKMVAGISGQSWDDKKKKAAIREIRTKENRKKLEAEARRVLVSQRVQELAERRLAGLIAQARKLFENLEV